MTNLEVHLDPTFHLVGAIVQSDDAADLSQDMIDIRLPNGLLVHAGWYPDSDPNGEYRITLYRGLQRVRAPIYTKDAWQAVEELTNLCKAEEITWT